MNKTAESIERQESRKRDEKTADSSRFLSENSSPVSQKRGRGDGMRLKPYWFQPGQSGNPGGRPKVDLASEIARALFEQDGPAIFAAFQKVLRKGSPYAFQVLSDRAFGKLKETNAIEYSPYKDLSDEDLEVRIRELEEKLGYRSPEPKILPPASDDSKPN
jgi:hypothetical protein